MLDDVVDAQPFTAKSTTSGLAGHFEADKIRLCATQPQRLRQQVFAVAIETGRERGLTTDRDV